MKKLKIKFNFNPFKKGINQVLGLLEKDIMEAFWSCGEASIKTILNELQSRRDISYSTVITVTNRLAKKGLLKKRKVGKAYLYSPAYSKEEFTEIVSKKIVEGVSKLSFQSAIAHFVDYMASIEPDKIEYFSQLIESKKQSLTKEHTEKKKI